MNTSYNLKKLSQSAGLSVESIIPEGSRYLYVDNGSDILGVAHLDTVQKPTKKIKLHQQGKQISLYNPVWDDRLGLYTLTYQLPKYHNIKIDWLFTTDEEIGQTTAQEFVTDWLAVKDGGVAVHGNAPKESWNWIVEFDRMGTDVAVYDYGDKEFDNILLNYFTTVSNGSFTDITEMQELNVKGFNVGVGYHNPHSANAYFIVGDYLKQIERFVQFYKAYKTTKLEHEPVVYNKWSKWDNYKYDDSYYKDYETYYGKLKLDPYPAVNMSTATTEHECSICAGDGATEVSTLLNGEPLCLCIDCIEYIVDTYYK